MRFRKTLLSAAVALTASASVHAFEFTSVYILGDSLSDAGQYGARFTTNPGLTASEYLAQRFGFTVKPSTQGGTNYAYGGARVTSQGPYNPQATPVAGQVTSVIARGNGALDPNALYVLQGGANDIFYHAALTAAGAETGAAAQAAIGTAATDFLGQIAKLRAAGARYIVVMNLPDIGKTPQGTSSGAAGAAALSGLSTQVFNSTLNIGLNNIGFDVIPVNIQGFFNELIANPSLYGFTNAANLACTSVVGGSVSSLACTPSTLVNAAAPNGYLFADGVHPTTGAHKITAQYIASILQAPEQIGLLAEAPMAMSATQGKLLDARTRDRAGPVGAVNVYGGFEFGKSKIDSTTQTIGTDGDVSSFNVGGDMQMGGGLRAGALYSYGENKSDFGQNSGSFKLRENMLSFYAALNTGAWYVGGSVGAGDLQYKDVRRNIELGTTVRTETGRTKGNQLVARAVGGMNFVSGPIVHGPIISLTWQQIKVSGYTELGANSTTMQFTEQTRKSLISSLGYAMSAQFGSVTPWARVSLENEHKNDGREVRANLVTMGGSFALPAYKVDDNYGKVDLGASVQFTKGLSGFVNYTTTFSQGNQKNDVVMVGMNLAM